ncbi:hypothetical protein OAG14_02130 [Akkermansiaceae bacterium]|nr:hypothetical protein [Akkermansiaceae bacterium]
MIFFFWLVAGVLFLDNPDLELYFNRVFRLTNLFFGVLVIPNVLFKTKVDFVKTLNAICFCCGILCVLTLVEVIMVKMGYYADFRLVGKEFDKASDRPCAIYSETSIIGIILVICNFLIFSAQEILNKKRALWDALLALNSITIIFTASVSGIIGLFGFIILSANSKLKQYLVFFSFISLVTFFLNVDRFSKDLEERFNRIVKSEDNSANQRLIGAWSVPFYHLDNLVVGAGTGHEVRFLAEVNLIGEQISIYNAKSNNSLAFVFLENGAIGLVLFLILIYSFLGVDKLLPIIILFYCFSHGQYFSSILWWSVIVFLSAKSLKMHRKGYVN